MHNASSGNKIRCWFLLNARASVKMTCRSASYKLLITVLLSGICGRYTIHTLLPYRSFSVPWSEWPGMLESRPVIRRGKSAPRKFFALLPEKCVGHSFKILDIVQKIWAPLGKLFAPPGVPSWLRACWREMAWRGHLPACSFKTGQRDWRRLFIRSSWAISLFVRIELKEIYCNYSRTQDIQNGVQ